MQYKKVLNNVLAKIKPKGKSNIVEDTVKEINKALRKSSIKAKAMVGGSYAKNTYLSDKYDVDVFVKFDFKHYKGHSLSPLLEDALKDFKLEVIHGSRDYYSFEKDGIVFEVVPVLGIRKPEDADNIMDYSPLHVEWMIKNGGKFEDDIRLAKQFCKGAGIYGAESYIKGFSGHTLDILIIHYKGFINLLKAAKDWGERVVLDHENVHKGKALEKLNVAKVQSPLIVVDPVFSERNASANLNTEKFEKFKECAEAFLKNPSDKFFIEKKIDINELEKKGAVVVEFVPVEGMKDVVGSKLLKVYEFMKKGLKDYGVVDSGWEWNYGEHATLWYLLERKELEPTFEQEGPPLSQRPFVVAFKKKHKKTYERDKRVYAEVKRSCIMINKCLQLMFKDLYVKERVKKGKVVSA